MTEETEEKSTPAQVPTGLAYALQWSQLPAEHLQITLKAIEPELKREHELRMERETHKQELEIERIRLASARSQLTDQLAFDEQQAKRGHTLYLVGLVAGFLLSTGMLVGAVIVGLNDQPWLSALLAGPSLLALATLFVLRKNDRTLNAGADQNARRALNASQQPAPPPAGPVV
ncbi:hypothetical protein ACWGVR_29190 [Streptomyces xanthophaeus]